MNNMFNTKPSLSTIERLLFCLLSAYFLVSFALYVNRLVVITKYPYELAKGVEGIILNETIKIIDGRPIYTSINDRPYLIANYPPLYQILCASAMKLTGSRTLFTGRLISSLASLCIGALIFFIVSNKTRLRRYGVFAVLVFCSFWYILDFSPDCRVDMLGILFGLLGLYWLEKYSGSKTVYLSIPFFIMAFFTKQSLILAPVSAMIYLFFKNKTRAAVFSSLLILTTCVIFWLIELNTRGEFHKHLYLSFTGPFRWDVSLSWFKNFVISYPVYIALALYGVYKLFLDKSIDVYCIYFFFALIPALGVGKYGAYSNYYIELCLATAILAGIGFKRVFENFSARSRVIALFLLCLQMNNLMAVEFNGENLSISRKPGWSFFPAKGDYDNGARLVSAIKNIPGQGFSEGDNTCLLLAGKEIEYHYFLPVYIPAWNPDKFLNDVRSGRYSFFISSRDYSLNGQTAHEDDFGSTKFNLYRQLYRLKEKIGDYYIYTRPVTDTSAKLTDTGKDNRANMI